MKFSSDTPPDLDATDRAILTLVQENCKQSLAAIGEKVGLKAPSVVERIHKLEEAGVITGYVALIDARRLGKDVTAFIGVSTEQPASIATLEAQIAAIDEVLECHHVTGTHTLMIKVKTRNTQTLEQLIESVRRLDGVTKTETSIVLSTFSEGTHIAVEPDADFGCRPARRSSAAKTRRAAP
jgi:Lrp/AsnC family leucine-responsive transcriptional regulator